MNDRHRVDLLELAEAVAGGSLAMTAAEDHVRAIERGDAAERTVRELRSMVVAATAVRAHATAWRDALAVSVQPEPSADGRVVTGPVAAGAVRRPTPAPRPRTGPRRIGMLVAATIVVGAGVAGVALLGGRPFQTTPAPSLRAVAIESATPEASETLPPETARPTPAEPTGPVVRFGQIEGLVGDRDRYIGLARLVSDTVGWVSTPTGLHRTIDSGKTWTPVSFPRGVAPLKTSIVDADTVVVELDGNPPTIASTHDGGATWTEVPLPGVRSGTHLALAMRSALVGSATYPAGGEVSEPIFVYSTQDGGATWSGPIESRLPDIGESLLKIIPGEHGVIAYHNGKYDNKPFDDLMWLTIDGGVSWKQRSFPIDTVSRKGLFKQFAGTPWIDDERIVIAVDVVHIRTGVDVMAIYESLDDGRSWRRISQFPGDPGVQMLSGTDWVTQSEGRVWSTRDGGANWRPIDVTAPSFDTSFVTVDHGWAVHECRFGADAYCDGTDPTPVLFETTDGGRTWMEIG